METLFLSNWQHEQNGERLSNPSRMQHVEHGDEIVRRGDMEAKRTEERRIRSGQPYYKRRRIRGGMMAPGNGRVKDADASVPSEVI